MCQTDILWIFINCLKVFVEQNKIESMSRYSVDLYELAVSVGQRVVCKIIFTWLHLIFTALL